MARSPGSSEAGGPAPGPWPTATATATATAAATARTTHDRTGTARSPEGCGSACSTITFRPRCRHFAANYSTCSARPTLRIAAHGLRGPSALPHPDSRPRRAPPNTLEHPRTLSNTANAGETRSDGNARALHGLRSTGRLACLPRLRARCPQRSRRPARSLPRALSRRNGQARPAPPHAAAPPTNGRARRAALRSLIGPPSTCSGRRRLRHAPFARDPFPSLPCPELSRAEPRQSHPRRVRYRDSECREFVGCTKGVGLGCMFGGVSKDVREVVGTSGYERCVLPSRLTSRRVALGTIYSLAVSRALRALPTVFTVFTAHTRGATDVCASIAFSRSPLCSATGRFAG